jgi:hypothetical protein
MKKCLFAGILALLCLSCNNRKMQETIDPPDVTQYQTADTIKNVNTIESNTPSDNKIIEWDKKLIKTATLELQVKNFKSYSKELGQLVKRYGGYISSENQVQAAGKLENTVTIKVPVPEFEDMVDGVENAGIKTDEKTIQTEDVTGTISDGQARLIAKRKVRERYLDLLKQAKNMEEILVVQKEINGLQENIEAVSGQVNLLQHSSALSTIHLTYYERLQEEKTSNPENENSLLNKVSRAFTTGLDFLATILLFLLYIWPLILLSFAGFLLYRRSRKQKDKPL